MKIKKSPEVISQIIKPNGNFPNNAQYPLLIYKNVLEMADEKPSNIEDFFKENGWVNSWVDSIYDFQHYHSNTHEALVIFEGNCTIEIGGDQGVFFEITKGDVIIFPAGVSHKNVKSSNDFTTVGAYPFDVDYDMNYGKVEEHPRVDNNIQNVKLPETDPIFGKNGLLFKYWN